MLEAYLLSVIISLVVFGVKANEVNKRVEELGYKVNDLKHLSIFRRGLVRVLDIIFILIEMILKCAIPVANIGLSARTMLNWQSEIFSKLESLESVGIIIQPEIVKPNLGNEHKTTARVFTPYGCKPTAYAYEPVEMPSQEIQSQGIQKVRR